VFRRKSAGEPDGTTQDSPGAQSPGSPADTKVRPAAQAGKGRPTPKRKEAEAGRYQPIGGPKRTAGPRTPADKATARSERTRRNVAMKAGEDWALLPKDRGPVRALARDYIDSRRRFTEYVMYFLVLMLASIVARNKAVQSYIVILELVVLVGVAIDGFFISRGVRRAVAAKATDGDIRGLTWYSMTRALSPRWMRTPAPRVTPGAKALWSTVTSGLAG
jgi:DUF3043 family protein